MSEDIKYTLFAIIIFFTALALYPFMANLLGSGKRVLVLYCVLFCVYVIGLPFGKKDNPE